MRIETSGAERSEATAPRPTLLLACFFLSGFAALLYETAWTREFESVFGTSELAVVSVLATYMAGLAIGSAVASRFVTRTRRPILWYGLLEFGIAASALAVPWGIRGCTWLLEVGLGGREAPPGSSELSIAYFYVAAGFAVLIVPTALMGATLPLLARHSVRRDEEVGSRVGTLYAVNTFGAVCGTAATGFVLLPEIGLRSTVHVGAAINALVFAVAALLTRRAGIDAREPDPRRPAAPHLHWVLPVAALSGAVSFAYEVLWTRLIGQIVGGTVQGFATMLASFLLGIALGSAAASRHARDAARAARGLAIAQLGAAGFSLLAFAGLDRIPDLAAQLGSGHAGALAGNALIAALVLLPGALCIGAVFPFAVRILARDELDAGPAAARVYAWNTLGSITGALASGFVLLPALHFEGTVRAAAGANLALAIVAGAATRPVARGIVAAAVASLAGVALVAPQPPWAVLRHSAMLGSSSQWRGAVEYYGVGRSSTVLIYEAPGGLRIATNGLPESVIPRGGVDIGDVSPGRWLGMLPSLLRPDLGDVLVIGLGGGLTVEAVPSSVDRITVIELEEEVVRAHEALAAERADSPLRDPRVAVVVNDARGALALTRARWGAIVSQPSHPWTAGASHLYTREFFELAARHLEPRGVFVQWIGLSFVSEELLARLLATLLSVFPHVTAFMPDPGSVLFAASDSPIDPTATAGAALAAHPDDFARFGIRVPEDVAARWVLAAGDAAGFRDAVAPLTDDDNPLATRSAWLKGKTFPRSSWPSFGAEPLDLAESGLDREYVIARIAEAGNLERAVRLAEATPDPTERLSALGWARSARQPRRAALAFRKALAADPDLGRARFGLLRAMRDRIERGDPDAIALAAPLDGGAAAVVRGWQDAAGERWEELGDLDASLAAIDVRDPSAVDALRLRVRWRLASGQRAALPETASLASELIRRTVDEQDLLLAARAFAAAGRPADALGLIDRVSRVPRAADAKREALDLLRSLPADLEPDDRKELEARLLRSTQKRRSGRSTRQRPPRSDDASG